MGKLSCPFQCLIAKLKTSQGQTIAIICLQAGLFLDSLCHLDVALHLCIAQAMMSIMVCSWLSILQSANSLLGTCIRCQVGVPFANTSMAILLDAMCPQCQHTAYTYALCTPAAVPCHKSASHTGIDMK